MTRHYDPRLESPLRFNRGERSGRRMHRKNKAAPKRDKTARTLMSSASNRYRWSEPDGGLIPLEEWEKDNVRTTRVELLSDIADQPIVSPIDGSRHRSKKGYTRHVHGHGKTIVGNESLKPVEQNRRRLEPVSQTMRRVCERMGVDG